MPPIPNPLPTMLGGSPALASPALRGIGLTVLGVFLFAANDALGKSLVAAATIGQILLIRSTAAFVLLTPVLWRAGAGPFRRAPRPGLQALRIVLAMAEVALFYLALSALPLGETLTIYLAAPIYVTALSPWLLGESVGWRRWAAVLVGFAGVVLAMQPGSAAPSFGLLAAVAGSLVYALMLVITRRLSGTDNRVLLTGQLGGGWVLGAALVLAGDWAPIDAGTTARLALLGVVAMAGMACVNRALLIAPASVVAPYHYTLIVWALAFGAIFFGEEPGPGTLAGAALITGAGLFIFFREKVRSGTVKREHAIPPG
ncbi:DMT family transporter [Roseomonas sp. OT10]|uniref:DMT family transporter n=1 Tax=Roseomonas cutis TaxID=2897332 RepID=UPI001E51B85B|nr:DMT family transporter [Roseomonas sp. OT10]UFN50040.1 DMT family transporter [Roseomonas sp. OT10]